MAIKKIAITIPDYLSVGKYQLLQNLEHLTELNKVIETIAIITDMDKNELMTWTPKDLAMVYSDVIKCMDQKESFYPIFESADGTLYGYSNINEMTLAEFTDLERLCAKPNENLHEIMAVLYRPIETHRFKDFTWNVAHTFRVNIRKMDNIFKHYKLKKYDSSDRITDGEQLGKEIPLAFALGALGFFLGTANGYLNTTNRSSNQQEEEKMRKLDLMNLRVLVSIGGGLRQFIHSRKRIFSLSQEKVVSLT